MITEHTHNLPACQRSFLTTLPLSTHTHTDVAIQLAQEIAPQHCPCIVYQLTQDLATQHCPSIVISVHSQSAYIAFHILPNSLHCHSDIYETPNTAIPGMPAMLHTCSKGP